VLVKLGPAHSTAQRLPLHSTCASAAVLARKTVGAGPSVGSAAKTKSKKRSVGGTSGATKSHIPTRSASRSLKALCTRVHCAGEFNQRVALRRCVERPAVDCGRHALVRGQEGRGEQSIRDGLRHAQQLGLATLPRLAQRVLQGAALR